MTKLVPFVSSDRSAQVERKASRRAAQFPGVSHSCMPIQTQSAWTFLDVTAGGWFRKRSYGVNIEIERLR